MDADTVACQKIIDAKSPFECFDLPLQEIEPAVVRSLYLKIAVKVHPDKNKSHLATQAFQVESENFSFCTCRWKVCQLFIMAIHLV